MSYLRAAPLRIYEYSKRVVGLTSDYASFLITLRNEVFPK